MASLPHNTTAPAEKAFANPNLCDCTRSAIGPLVALIPLVTIAFFFKVISISRAKAALNLDSIIAYTTFATILGLFVTSSLFAHYGGFDDLNDANYNGKNRSKAAFMAIYYFAILAVKLSLLSLYFRAFSNPLHTLRARLKTPSGILILSNAIVNILWTGVVYFFWYGDFLTLFITGSPEDFTEAKERMWEISRRGSKAVGWVNAGTDLCILAVAFVGMREVQLSRQSKRALYVALGIGGLATAASLYRAIWTTKLSREAKTGARFEVGEFSALSWEVGLGWVCFCAGAVRNCVKKLEWVWVGEMGSELGRVGRGVGAWFRGLKGVRVRDTRVRQDRGRAAADGAEAESQIELVRVSARAS